jgi:hypothetical protein
MLKLSDLVDEITGDDKDMELVVKDYDGKVHTLRNDLMFDYQDNHIIMEMHDEKS